MMGLDGMVSISPFAEENPNFLFLIEHTRREEGGAHPLGLQNDAMQRYSMVP